MSLKPYRRKRRFKATPEPKGSRKSGRGLLRFVIQKHDATRTHFDFRLELDGVLKSWAVPKGPSLNPLDQRLAVQVEDHPLEYATFEGVIPKGHYGAGAVIVWDRGTYRERHSEGRADSERALREGLARGKITVVLDGEKLKGEFALVKLKGKGRDKSPWLLIKKRDEYARYRPDTVDDDRSVKTGRKLAEIEMEPAAKRATAKPLPHRVRPQVPVAASRLPRGEAWRYEPLFGGVRAVAEVEKGRASLHSAHLLPLDRKHPEVTRALARLTGPLVLDGEIADGVFWISDLLYAKGKDLRDLPLSRRRKELERLKLDEPLRLTPREPSAEALEAPAVVAKHEDAPYRSGVRKTWVKVKTGTAVAAEPPFTHLDKIYWPRERITKGDMIDYYRRIGPWILPHLKDRPLSLHRHPDGIEGESFFHKDMTGYIPRRLRTVPVHSASSNKTIHYLVVDDLYGLLYAANLGCIELNPWLSRAPNLDRPDYLVIDLDPDGNPFDEVVRVARAVHEVLDRAGVESFVKTSGSSGLHIAVPLGARYPYDDGRDFALAVCGIVHERFPALTSLERNPARRRRKIYLDCYQNRRGQTLAAPYGLRPRPGAPVATPLHWREVKRGLSPDAFNMKTIFRRLDKVGDLWAGLLRGSTDLKKAKARIQRP